MSRSDTVELLNSTDDLAGKMRWMEFQHEMDEVLWRTPERDESWWRPGEPLVERYAYNYGHTRRFMEELSDDYDLAMYSGATQAWCRECQVGWDDVKRSCWSCGGEEVETAGYAGYYVAGGNQSAPRYKGEYTPEGLFVDVEPMLESTQDIGGCPCPSCRSTGGQPWVGLTVVAETPRDYDAQFASYLDYALENIVSREIVFDVETFRMQPNRLMLWYSGESTVRFYLNEWVSSTAAMAEEGRQVVVVTDDEGCDQLLQIPLEIPTETVYETPRVSLNAATIDYITNSQRWTELRPNITSQRRRRQL